MNDAAPAGNSKPWNIRRTIRFALGLTGTAFLLTTLAANWQAVREIVLPSPLRLVFGGLLLTVAIPMLGRGWSSLMPQGVEPQLVRRSYYLANPAKYIPGGFAHPLGQITLNVTTGITGRDTMTAFVIHGAIIATGGAFLGSAVTFSSAPPWLRVAAALAVLSPILASRRVLGVVVRGLERLGMQPLTVPNQRALNQSLFWTGASLALGGLSFSVLGGIGLQATLWQVVPAFCLAFTAGFLAIPFPAGVGVRELILVAILPDAGLPAVVAVSVVHRSLTMLAELVILLLSHITPNTRWRRLI